MDNNTLGGCGCALVVGLLLPSLILSLYLGEFWPIAGSVTISLCLLFLLFKSESSSSALDEEHDFEDEVRKYNERRDESAQVRAAREKAEQRRAEFSHPGFEQREQEDDQIKAQFDASEPSSQSMSPKSEKIASIHHMTGIKFELFMKRFLEHQGYEVTLTQFSGDQGVDLILKDNGRKVAIQTKRYTRPLGNKPVQEIIAGRIYYKADEAWVLATSSFTKGAVDLAKRANVKLIDGRELEKWLEEEWDETLSRLLD